MYKWLVKEKGSFNSVCNMCSLPAVLWGQNQGVGPVGSSTPSRSGLPKSPSGQSGFGGTLTYLEWDSLPEQSCVLTPRLCGDKFKYLGSVIGHRAVFLIVLWLCFINS